MRWASKNVELEIDIDPNKTCSAVFEYESEELDLPRAHRFQKQWISCTLPSVALRKISAGCDPGLGSRRGHIPDHHRLLRRIPDYQLADAEPDSSNFREKEEGTGLSVSVWTSPGDLDRLLAEYPGWELTTLVVSDVRKSISRHAGSVARIPNDSRFGESAQKRPKN